jgi:hypothetical protein
MSDTIHQAAPQVPPPLHGSRLAAAGLAGLVLVLIAGVLVLFPFDWLEEVWPAYGWVFDIVFATALAHLIGHATLFFLAGLLVLAALPPLRRRQWVYLGIMLAGAVAQEAIQSLAKLQLPTLWDGRDLLLDLAGFLAAYAVAYVIVCLWPRVHRPDPSSSEA